MIRGYVICEGQTEETFIRDVIAPLLAPQQIFFTARLIPTSQNSKGGALTYERVRRFVINSLKEDQSLFITTFFDLYALDNAFPISMKAKSKLMFIAKSLVLNRPLKMMLLKKTHHLQLVFYRIFSLMNLKACCFLILPN